MKNDIIMYVFKENLFLNYKNNVSPKIKHCSYPYIYQIIFLIYIAKKTKPIFLPPLTLF